MLLNNTLPIIKALKSATIIALFVVSLFALALAGEYTVFGPKDYIRRTGEPVTVTDNFQVPNPNTEFTLCVYNGGLQDAGTELVSSSIISINGQQVVGPQELNQKVRLIEKAVSLQSVNTIEIEVRGKPGGLFTIRIVGTDNAPPEIYNLSPADGSTIPANTPLVEISYSDSDSGINLATLEISIDGINCRESFNITPTGASYQFSPEAALADGAHTIQSTVKDWAGNLASAVSVFMVATHVPPPITEQSGFIHGLVFDAATEQPLEAVTVTVLGIEGTVTSDTQGNFSFPVPDSGKYKLTAEKEGYTFGQREIEVVSARDARVEPIYLSSLDTSVTIITSAGGKAINSTGKVELTIPANALPPGTESIEVRATLYEQDKQLPAPLPKTSFYTYALDFKPDNTQFTQPVSVRLANELGFAPGTKIPIGYYNTQTFAWEDTGLKATVSADRLWVDFQVMHFSPYDVNLPAAPLLSQRQPGVTAYSGQNKDIAKNCAKDISNSAVLLKSGALLLDHSLPSIRELNSEHGLTFIYNSLTANPSGPIFVDTNLDPAVTTVPSSVTLELSIAGRCEKVSYKGTSGKARYAYFYDYKNARGEKLSTGSYPYTIGISNFYTDIKYGTADYFGGPVTGGTGIRTREPVGLTRIIKGRIPVNNLQDSAFGSGWSLAQLERLYKDPDGPLVVAEGDGSVKVFEKKTAGFSGLVTANWSGNDISVFLGKGDGTFQGQSTYPAGQSPHAVATGDFNQDTFTDLAVPNYNTRDISIYLGNGDGTFRDQTRYPANIGPRVIAVADFNQDMIQDLAAVNVNSDDVSIFLGNGDGTFQDQAVYPAGYHPQSVVADDFNRDGFQDLAVANFMASFVSILLGNGDGTFKNQTGYPVAFGPHQAIVAADFNRDSFVDLALPGVYGYNLSVVFGNGDGSFKRPVIYAVGMFPMGVAAGDFNGDGAIDLVVSNWSSDTVSVLLNNCDGTFQGQVTYPVSDGPKSSVAVGDFNQDSFLDLVVPNSGTNTIGLLLGNGDGTFQEQVTYPAGYMPSFVTAFNPSSTTFPQGAYVSSEGDYSYILQNPDGTYTRFFKDGTRILFNKAGLHTQTIDKNGNTTSYTYADANGDGKKEELVSIILPTGAEYQFIYNSQGKLYRIADPAGRTTNFNIDTEGNLMQITNPDGTTKGYDYDANHLLTTKTDERGLITEYLYDKYGAIKEVRSPEREVAEVAIDGSITQQRLKETRLYYPSDVKGLINDLPPDTGTPQNPADVIRPQDITEKLIDGKGNAWTYRTDKFGGRLKFVDSLNNIVSYERDAGSNLTKLTRANGSAVRMKYDAKGNLIAVIEESNQAATRITYEPNFNQPTSIKDPLNNLTSIEYDQKGNPVQITDARGSVTRIEYNLRGQVTKIIQAVGTAQQSETGFTYDPATFNLVSIIDPLANPTTFTYNSAGNIKTITDAENKTTTYTYDSMNRLKSVVDADNKTTTYAYDSSGNVTSVTDANNNKTSLSYDEQGQLVKATNPLNQQRLFSYNVNRNLSLVVTPNGDSIKFYYNAANLLEKKFSPSDTVDYAYDSLYNLSGISDADSSLSFVYDSMGRLIEAKTNAGFLQPKTFIAYSYDKNNNLLTMTDPQAKVTKYLYDSLSRLTDIKDQQDQVIARFAYDELSRRISQSLPNGVTTSFTHDLKGQLLSLTHSPLSLSYAYTYDKVGNQKTKTDVVGLHSYDYDNIYRLTSVSHPTPPQEAYSYDAIGNRNPSSFTYNTANRLLEDSSYTYAYDNNGNLITKTSKQDSTTTTYTYDAEDRLIAVTTPTTTATYSYDPLGRRIEKNVSGTITRYIYDGEDILLEYDGTNTLQSRYTHGPGIDEPLVMQRGGQSYYYHADALGSITTITDSVGNVVQSYAYESFGKVSQTGSLTQPYTYTGREYDPETGLYYYRARYYDPDTGRFLQEDPLWDINLYAYVDNNPINQTDPYGLFGMDYMPIFLPLPPVGGPLFPPSFKPPMPIVYECKIKSEGINESIIHPATAGAKEKGEKGKGKKEEKEKEGRKKTIEEHWEYYRHPRDPYEKEHKRREIRRLIREYRKRFGRD